MASGGFGKDVAVPFSSVRASEKNNKWYLVLNTNKDALKAAPGFTHDKTKNDLNACRYIDNDEARRGAAKAGDSGPALPMAIGRGAVI